MLASDPQIPYVLALSRVPGLGPVTLRHLLKEMGSPQAVWEASPAALRALQPSRAEAIETTRRGVCPARLHDDVTRAGATVLAWGCAGYPPALRDVAQAPLVLYVRGCVDLLSAPAVAVVGTRRPSLYALRATELFVRQFAEAGVCVVSGMARGIDEAAHRHALQSGGQTVAVLGCGVDVCYPPESRALKQAIEASGAVVSQFAPGEPPLGPHFPVRNRVICGLSRAVVVMEAALKSGAMITATCAVDQDRPLFAAPGSVLNSQSAGCNHLLSEGTAVLARDARDVLAELGWTSAPPTPAPTRPSDEAGQAVWAVLDAQSGFDGAWLEVEEIAVRSGMQAQACVRALVRMELEGFVLRGAGNRYRLR